mmetsp:Transcript_4035/g.8256  ORF Transcript_4035/g.8256 Transcript_4035/m.8256 type:complete len:257 (-) Transcript_4035:391-1161(-)
MPLQLLVSQRLPHVWLGTCLKVHKRIRLGHSGHFGKVEVIPVLGKPKKPETDKKGRKRKNKFKEDAEESGAGAIEEDDIVDHDMLEKQQEQRTERLPGESFSKFMKRLNKETREKLLKEASKAQRVNEKRKDYLQKRKLEKKVAKAEKQVRVIRPDDEAGAKSEPASSSVPRFGEQADRPPQIRLEKALRGLHKPVPAGSNGKGYVVGGMPAIPEVGGAEKRRREMEMLRKSAIQQYRNVVQAKRENSGHVSLGSF